MVVLIFVLQQMPQNLDLGSCHSGYLLLLSEHMIVVSTLMMWGTSDWINFCTIQILCEVSSKVFIEGLNCLSELAPHNSRPWHIKHTF